MNIRHYLIMNTDGEEIEADAYGNYLAFKCEICDHPVLATAIKNKQGSDQNHPTTCKGCGKRHYLDIRLRAEKLYIHSPDDIMTPEFEKIKARIEKILSSN